MMAEFRNLKTRPSDRGLAIFPRIVSMDVGQVLCFPISRMMSVRSMASNAGLQLARKYVTTTDKEEGVIKVLRQS